MRRLVATVLTAASLVMATSAMAEAADGPVRSLSMTSTYAGQGTCEVRFTWTPRTTLDHFEYVVTDVRPDPAGDWQPGASTTTNLGIKRTVARGGRTLADPHGCARRWHNHDQHPGRPRCRRLLRRSGPRR